VFAGVAFGRKSVTRRPLDRRAEPGGGGGAAKGVYSVGAVALTGRWKKRRVLPFGGEAISAVGGRRGGRETRRSAFLRRPRCLSTLPDERYGSPGLSGAETASSMVRMDRGPAQRQLRRASWFLASNERNFAQTTTNTRPETHQQLP